jgi:hypothetical protein
MYATPRRIWLQAPRFVADLVSDRQSEAATLHRSDRMQKVDLVPLHRPDFSIARWLTMNGRSSVRIYGSARFPLRFPYMQLYSYIKAGMRNRTQSATLTGRGRGRSGAIGLPGCEDSSTSQSCCRPARRDRGCRSRAGRMGGDGKRQRSRSSANLIPAASNAPKDRCRKVEAATISVAPLVTFTRRGSGRRAGSPHL